MSNNNNNKRILLVGDEPDIGLSFKIALEDNGFAVDVFDDPEKHQLISNLISMIYCYWISRCPTWME